MTASPASFGGFAPGNYDCLCLICDQTFEGDKRAFQCRPCAMLGNFARFIRKSREDKGLSLSAAARAAGITKAHLHDMEHGRSRNPGISTLMGLARAYDGSVPYMAAVAAQSFQPDAASADARSVISGQQRPNTNKAPQP